MRSTEGGQGKRAPWKPFFSSLKTETASARQRRAKTERNCLSPHGKRWRRMVEKRENKLPSSVGGSVSPPPSHASSCLPLAGTTLERRTKSSRALSEMNPAANRPSARGGIPRRPPLQRGKNRRTPRVLVFGM